MILSFVLINLKKVLRVKFRRNARGLFLNVYSPTGSDPAKTFNDEDESYDCNQMIVDKDIECPHRLFGYCIWHNRDCMYNKLVFLIFSFSSFSFHTIRKWECSSPPFPIIRVNLR